MTERAEVGAASARPPMKRQALAKCGTESGYNRHIRDGDDHCNACSAAKAKADARRRNAQDDGVLRNRAHAAAQARAHTALGRAHPEEYAALYAKFKAEVYAERGIAPRNPPTPTP